MQRSLTKYLLEYKVLFTPEWKKPSKRKSKPKTLRHDVCPSLFLQRMHFEKLSNKLPNWIVFTFPQESGCSTSESGSPLTHNLGQAHFKVNFDQHRSILSVKLVKAMNLSPLGKDWSKPCNPYVIVQLLPDYRHQLQSTVHKKTTNPRFDETFEFEVKVLVNYTHLVFISDFQSARHRIGITLALSFSSRQ